MYNGFIISIFVYKIFDKCLYLKLKIFLNIILALLRKIVLHIFNISRIIGLNILCIEYPQYINIGHDYAFPAFIYGGVVLLWIVWVKFYVLKK